MPSLGVQAPSKCSCPDRQQTTLPLQPQTLLPCELSLPFLFLSGLLPEDTTSPSLPPGVAANPLPPALTSDRGAGVPPAG